MKNPSKNQSRTNDTDAAAIAQALLKWFGANQRKLPWRTQRSLYKTVVSECMLQQTQIATALPYFHRWMQSFPNFQTLAQASESNVLKHWEGLGYYNRARRLRKLAQDYRKAKPRPKSAEQWLSFPGIGPYTAAAIASIAHGEKVAALDGNVVRVIARLSATSKNFKSLNAAAEYFRKPAGELIQASRQPGDHNEALMELGATICTPKKPLCEQCCLKTHCKGQRRAEAFPNLQRPKTKRRVVQRAFIQDKNKLLLHRAPENARRLSGLWELPELACLKLKTPKETPLLSQSRSIANERIRESIYPFPPSPTLRKRSDKNPELNWIQTEKLQELSLSGPHKRWIARLLQNQRPRA